MAPHPRSHQRRPLTQRPAFEGGGDTRPVEGGAALPSTRRSAPTAGQHIPHFFVMSSSQAEDGSTASASGAQRFPGQPTPVIGAAISMFGMPSLEAACQPWRRQRSGYRFARIKRDGSGQQVESLSTARFPKV